MCDCLISTWIEAQLFDAKPIDPNDIPDENCPLCLHPLRLETPNTCCGSYSKPLKCGHYTHVSCQINKNQDLNKCSVCQKQLSDNHLYFNICKSKIISILPLHYQKKYHENNLSQQEIYELAANGIDYYKIKTVTDYLEFIKNDQSEMNYFFKTIWLKNKTNENSN